MEKINNNEDKIENLCKKILKFLHIKLSEKNEKLFIQIFKFLIVGCIATVIDFVFLYIFKELVDLSVVIANTLSFCISVVYNYIASVIWVFDVNKNKDSKKQFLIFIIFSVIGLILSDIIISFATDNLKIHYMISKVIATVIVMIFNFITRKMFLE